MGEVYQAIDRATGDPVALKRLLPSANAKMVSLFEREYRTLSGLRHPCIVEVFDYGDDDGAYYTMELVDGRELGQSAPLSWRAACRYLRDAASILGLLHARKLIHRDLSPRNLLLTVSGQLKLIDFGSLADFGPTEELVGTPPFVSPDAMGGNALDQRSDLFALGALGYLLITGENAYPARTHAELPQHWAHEPPPPSVRVARLGSALLPPVPVALDELIGELLRIDPSERPADTAELIDRLNLIAELTPEASEQAAAGYLASKAFVGRARERARFSTALQAAGAGQGQVLAVEGDAGVGRTRFLQELAVMARLAGALTLEVDASRGRKPYQVAVNLLLHLLRAQPDATRVAIGSHASALARVSSQLRRELTVAKSTRIGESAREERARLQNALFEVFLAIAQARLVALIVDDMQDVDEESQRLLTALALGAGNSRLCLVISVVRDPRAQPSASLNSLRDRAARIRMLPLTESETHELLRSVFGAVPNLERLADRLHRARRVTRRTASSWPGTSYAAGRCATWKAAGCCRRRPPPIACPGRARRACSRDSIGYRNWHAHWRSR